MLCGIESYIKKNRFEVDLRDCNYLGEGHNGIVYRMPDGRAIKIFKERKICSSEYQILKAVSGNKYFPNVYECGENYIVRDFVGGIAAHKYIKVNGLSKTLAFNIINLIDEFAKLKFTKLDIRCRDIFVQNDESLIIIDPKSSFTRNVSFPRHLAKGLKNLRVIDKFLDFVKEKNPELCEEWTLKMKKARVL